MLDVRFAVRDGLRQLLESDPDAWPGPTPLVFRGRLLDLVGSDARPLVILLASVAEQGVVSRLRSARDAGTPWTQARGPLVVSLTDEAFLRRDMAQWAVETWAHALGLARIDELTPGVGRPLPPPPVVASPVLRTGGPSGAPGTAAAASAAAIAARARPVATAAPRAAPGRPYVPANAPAGYRPPRPAVGPLGTRPSGGGLSPRVVQRSLVGVAAGVAVAIAVFMVAGPRRSLSSEPVAAAMRDAAPAAPVVVERPAAPAVGTATPATPTARARVPDATALGVPVMPQALPGVTAGALPASAADSARLVIVRPPLRAPVAQSAPTPPVIAPGRYATAGPAPERPGLGLRNVGTGNLDRVVKRNGDVVVGRVEVVRASEVQFLEAESRLRYAIPKREIREIITEFGNRVRFDTDAAAAPVAVAMGPLVRRGVGGTYDVAYRVASVTGSPECRGLWQKPPADDAFIVVHVPGADTLSLRADHGGTFSAVLDAAANFATSLLPQTEASVGSSAITSRMNGRFTSDGFTGEVSIIGYRRQPTGRDISCYSVLTAYGRKRR